MLGGSFSPLYISLREPPESAYSRGSPHPSDLLLRHSPEVSEISELLPHRTLVILDFSRRPSPSPMPSRTRSYAVGTSIYPHGISRPRRTSFFPVGRPPSYPRIRPVGCPLFGPSERLGSFPFFLAVSSLRDRLELAYSRRSIVARSDEKEAGILAAFSPLNRVFPDPRNKVEPGGFYGVFSTR